MENLMQQFEIGVSTKVYANLYVRAANGKEAWEKAKAWQLTEQEDSDIYLDEDRYLEDAWQLDSIQSIGE